GRGGVGGAAPRRPGPPQYPAPGAGVAAQPGAAGQPDFAGQPGAAGQYAVAGQPGVNGQQGPTPRPYPVRVDGRLDPGLNRWLWLGKWLLGIPHPFVLAFLWLAVRVPAPVARVARPFP